MATEETKNKIRDALKAGPKTSAELFSMGIGGKSEITEALEEIQQQHGNPRRTHTS